MSKRRPTKRNRHNSKEGGHFEVGFGKPPREHQFKKGQSGNPKGRPPRKKATPITHYNEPFKDIVLAEAYRKVSIQEGGKTVKLSLAEAGVRSIMLNAGNGNVQCQKMLTQMLTNIEKQDRIDKEAIFKEALEYKEKYSILVEELKRAGHPDPEIIPHPDHIHLDFALAEVKVKGPVTAQQKEKWDAMKERRSEAIANIKEARDMLMNTKNEKKKAMYRKDIDCEKAILAILNRYLDDHS